MNWIGWTVFGIGGMVAVVAGLAAFGSSRWAGTTQVQMALLEAARVPAPAGMNKVYDARELDGLPTPVQRYFRAVLKDGQPFISAATFDFAGTFNMSATGEQWKNFTSTQRAVTRRPGFLWNGRVVMLPGLVAHVHDSYIAGEGRLHAAMLGLFTVAEVQGGGEIARGELMRYFAEAIWYPTALLPSQGVRWEAVDDSSAKATLEDGPITLTLLFRFDETGLITSVHADARGVGVGKDMVMLPWEGRVSSYQLHGGMMVPARSEAAYLRPEGRRPYFIGNLTSMVYEFSS
ncbi:DUF6544 family protein [Hydrogenophaga sp. PAMC20947]|uniref:DUF6920 family protein n=1 Tax=Hydrogenophaga sp. PAMC20947 TaxID=2565558 RepID=UPI00109DD184|nr:DUF6544 family protein [Hydrogenophaga sp. PAMC20947]QCB45563.1 hypothetical protein E5678_05715 [Hydrogenophaga sp. PAMC20947]